MTQSDLIALAKQIATEHQLFPHIVCGICEQESSWQPYAYRYEPAFFARYIEPMLAGAKFTDTEARGRSISWGLMQVMGQVAREFNYADWLPALCDPATGIEWGCKVFEEKLRHAQGNTTQALQLWNGGSNPDYVPSVLAKAVKYQ